MFRETSITHLLILLVLVGICGCSKEQANSKEQVNPKEQVNSKEQDEQNEEVKCSEVPSYDECRKLSHCSAIRLTRTPGASGPVWACEEKSQP